MQNKLDYFEQEVRRLEQKLTQQKLQYEKRLKAIEKEQEEVNAKLEAEE